MITQQATPDDDRRREVERMSREMREQLAPATEGLIIRPKSKPRVMPA